MLLESGGFEPDERDPGIERGAGGRRAAGVALRRGRAGRTPRLRDTSAGTTNHSRTRECRPAEPVDFAPRPWLDTPGWPFPRSELEPWWDRATEVLRLVSTSFDWAQWDARDGLGPPLVETDRVTSVLFQVKFPFSFGATYREERRGFLAERPRHDARQRHRAGRVAARRRDVRATRVDTLAGNELEVAARVFVVATGGIETPRLLLASDGIVPGGIGNDHDLVGRYFAEHLQVPVGFAVLHRRVEDLGPYVGMDVVHDTDPDRTAGLRAALGRTSSAVLDAEQLGLELQFAPATRHPGEPTSRTGVSSDDVDTLVTTERDAPAPTGAYLQALGEQAPNHDSRVVLTDQRDTLGMRRVALD
ncbi:MAG: hypothetical protein U5R31_02640 [Acidimicrobiia bacterium]|nr:hypothetical protein [Acidimicrobiia bacterium]